MDDVDKLRAELKTARESYYNLNPLMSDQEYDAKKDKLQQLCPTDFEVQTVGAEPPKYSVWEKVKHEIPMGSLNKVNDVTGFLKWAQETNSSLFLNTYKLDGSSLAVKYENGKLVQCLSRGNGVIGEDVTYNAIQIPNLPKTINLNGTVNVRGEVLMHKDIFKEKYSDKYANPRNTAAGKIRDKKGGGKDSKNLHFYAFDILTKDEINTESGKLLLLDELHFDTPFASIGDVNNMIKDFQTIKENRDDIPYEIDGTVIKIESLKTQEELGSDNMRPNGQIAWKFDPAMGVTRVIGIKWQVGPTGRITGVAQLEPVNIGGVKITSVSLHNIAMFKQLQLFDGCEVLIERANDVIPYLRENLSSNIKI